MAQLLKFGAVSWMSLVMTMSILFLSGCSMIPEPRIQTVTKIEKTTVPTVARPKPLTLIDTKVYVVTKDNIDEFLQEFEELHGSVAFVAISMKDYENLALNIADMRRYLNQQKEIIVYYENAVSDDKDPSNETKTNNSGTTVDGDG